MRCSSRSSILVRGSPAPACWCSACSKSPGCKPRLRASMLTISQAGDILISCSSSVWQLVELIEDFGEVAGVQSGQLRYRLTARSLGEALSRGLHPGDLLQALHQHAGAGEPLTSMLER